MTFKSLQELKHQEAVQSRAGLTPPLGDCLGVPFILFLVESVLVL